MTPDERAKIIVDSMADRHSCEYYFPWDDLEKMIAMAICDAVAEERTDIYAIADQWHELYERLRQKGIEIK